MDGNQSICTSTEMFGHSYSMLRHLVMKLVYAYNISLVRIFLKFFSFFVIQQLFSFFRMSENQSDFIFLDLN